MVLVRILILLLLATEASAHNDLPAKGETSLRHGRKARLLKKDDKGKKDKAGGHGGNGGNSGNGGAGGNGGSNGATTDRVGVFNAENGCMTFPDGQTLSTQNVEEKHQCIDLANVPANVKDHPNSKINLESSCNGCFRIFNFLICDEDNDFDLACVCNGDFTCGQADTGGSGSVAVPEQGGGASNQEETDENKNDGNQSGSTEVVDPQQCVTNYQGHGLGVQTTDPDRVPLDLENGDCRASAHCGGGSHKPDACCLKHFCICGVPDISADAECRA